MKPVMDEEKIEKHKIFQEYKKKSGDSKKEMSEVLKEHEKERKI